MDALMTDPSLHLWQGNRHLGTIHVRDARIVVREMPISSIMSN
jgi:hypothetical protein